MAALFLPSSSPNCTPIEHAFAKSKQLRRGAESWTFDAFVPAISEAIDAVTSADARGCFANLGFALFDHLQ